MIRLHLHYVGVLSVDRSGGKQILALIFLSFQNAHGYLYYAVASRWINESSVQYAIGYQFYSQAFARQGIYTDE